MYGFTSRKRLIGVLVLTMTLLGVAGLFLLASPARVNGAPSRIKQEDTSANTLLSATGELTHYVYLPLVTRDYGPRSFRLGYCASGGDIMRYPDIRQLSAGWYVNFRVDADPARPLGMDHVQTIRLHQLTECWPDRIRDRDVCPYVTPYTYTLTSPRSWNGLVSAVEANPGALWLVGNEMDRHDWGYYEDGEVVNQGGQDEMLPTLYAQAYHEIYQTLKETDPTAQVAIGGIIQATPARLEYLTKIWNAYKNRYGNNMPVDVWNIHNFIFREDCKTHGADVPPGHDSCKGTIYDDKDHNDLDIFDKQIRAFRKWMKQRGQQNKPLIVSEYGIVYHHAGMKNPDLVRNFMLATFDYFANEKDCNLGYLKDDCRLVQRWAWFSLDSNNYNVYQRLFKQSTRQMTTLGGSFADYAHRHLDVQGNEVPNYWPEP